MRIIRVLLILFLVSPAWAEDFDYTWADTEWNTSWTDTVGAGACDTTDTFAYESTNGNPTYNRTRTCVGRNDNNVTRISVWTGTWEDLGVTSGHTVDTVQMLDLDTKVLTYSTCSGITFGPVELRDSADTLVATLWSGRSSTSAEGSFTAEGSQTAQDVGTLTASNASIEIWITGLTSTANDASATCTAVFDNLDLRVSASSGSGGAQDVFKRRIIRTISTQ